MRRYLLTVSHFRSPRTKFLPPYRRRFVSLGRLVSWRCFSEKHIPFGRSLNFQGTREEVFLTYLQFHLQMTTCFEKISFTYLDKGREMHTQTRSPLFTCSHREMPFRVFLQEKNFQIIFSLLSRNMKSEKPNPFLKFFCG